uniref:Regucalcin n=1 Tax=Branchiostoma floridae TaxID=7739 RepID=C3XWC8_BRAFL|eukprot:XP_002611652.1 hypothetical protein BRAFLDRAFT_63672 [Branchiostoma floridae]
MAVAVAVDEPGLCPEGPHWDNRTGTLLYVDIDGQKVHRWNPVTRQKDTVAMDCMVGAVVPREAGGVVVAAGTKFTFLDFETRQLTDVATVDQHKPTNRFNDGKCDAAGRFWAANRRKVVSFEESRDGVPDGMCIDTDGKLWVAMFGTGQVLQVDPETGTHLRTVKVPADQTTSCCFGGPNLDILYVTTASVGLSAEEVQQKPLSGCVFQVTGLGARGTPGLCYNG